MSIWQHNQTGRWCADFRDATGKRGVKTYDTKKLAQEFHDANRVDTRAGKPISNAKLTLAAAAAKWISEGKARDFERASLANRQTHIDKHILPRLSQMGIVRLSQITENTVELFRDRLLADLSRNLAKMVLGSLKGLLKANKHHAASAVKIETNRRKKKKLEVGVDIPTSAEVGRIIANCPTLHQRALFQTAAFTGLRASELRGLRWKDVNLGEDASVTVRQRADRYRVIGDPKTEGSARKVPISNVLAKVLREWKLKCPKGEHDLAFPTSLGTIQDLANIQYRQLEPVLIAAGVVDKDGKGKFAMHAFRHFYASYCINPAPQGLGLQIKEVQARLGHASIMMTADVYGHLFPVANAGAKQDALETAILSATDLQQKSAKLLKLQV